jgi:hypothetical protein
MKKQPLSGGVEPRLTEIHGAGRWPPPWTTASAHCGPTGRWPGSAAGPAAAEEAVARGNGHRCSVVAAVVGTTFVGNFVLMTFLEGFM